MIEMYSQESKPGSKNATYQKNVLSTSVSRPADPVITTDTDYIANTLLTASPRRASPLSGESRPCLPRGQQRGGTLFARGAQCSSWGIFEERILQQEVWLDRGRVG